MNCTLARSVSLTKNERESKQLALIVTPLQASFEIEYISCFGVQLVL